MAANLEHALKFVDLTLDQLPLPGNLSSLLQQNLSQSNQSDLENILRQQVENVITGIENRVRRKRSSDPVTTIRQCRNQGSNAGGSFRRLCTECSAVTQLGAGVFPPFINEVVCGDELLCLGNIGGCQQQVVKFNFLRFTGEFERDDDLSELFDGDVFSEELETFQQDIRTCCQCRAFSFFRG